MRYRGMKENRFRWFRKYHSRMIVCLDDFIRTGNHESLHKARVAAKHLGAIQWMLKKEFPKSKIDKIFAPLKALYKSTGAHRDQDNFYRWVMHQRIKPGKKFLLPKPKPIQKSVGRVFREQLADFNKIPGKVFPLLKKWKPKQTKKLLANTRKKVSGFQQHPLAKWHNERKKIKYLIYLHEFAGAKPKDFPVKKLNNLQDILGQWNDRRIFHRKINASKNIAKTNQQKLLGKLNKQTAALEKKIKGVKI